MPTNFRYFKCSRCKQFAKVEADDEYSPRSSSQPAVISTRGLQFDHDREYCRKCGYELEKILAETKEAPL